MIEKIGLFDIIIFVALIATTVNFGKDLLNGNVSKFSAIFSLFIILTALQHFSRRYKEIKSDTQ